MTTLTHRDIIWRRLYTQRVAGERFARPEDAVDVLVAVQSQDIAGAAWSLGQRVENGTAESVLAALNEGRILRTHVLRPTWHFLTPADIRWVLTLTAPRVHALNAYYLRQTELTEAQIVTCRDLMREHLAGGNHLTRPALAAIFSTHGIVAEGMRLTYIMMDAELEAIICSGAMRGKQQTYALLDERAPHARWLDRDLALIELTQRFFLGHGPATLGEFVRWSGLTVADAKQGLDAVKSDLEQAEIDGQKVWFGCDPTPSPPQETIVHLLPEYDEAVLTYNDVGFPEYGAETLAVSGNDTFFRPIVVNGQKAGTWRRRFERREVVIDVRLTAALGSIEEEALTRATERYGAYIGLPARWERFADV